MAELPHNYPDLFETPEEERAAARGIYYLLEDVIFNDPEELDDKTKDYDPSTGTTYFHRTAHIKDRRHTSKIFAIESRGRYGVWSVEVAADYGDKPWHPESYRLVSIEGDRGAFKKYARRER